MAPTDTDPNDTPKPVRAKWESELEEILAAADRAPTAVDKARSRVATARYQAPSKLRRITTRLGTGMTTGAWLLIFLGLVVVAWAVRHYSPLLGRALALVAVLLLVVIIIRALARPARAGDGGSQMWRGRDVGPMRPPQERSWLSRFFDRDSEK